MSSNISLKITSNNQKKKTYKVNRFKKKECIWIGELQKKGQSGRPLGNAQYQPRDFYLFPSEIRYYQKKKYLGTINLKKKWDHSLEQDVLQLIDANGKVYFLKDSSRNHGNIEIFNNILTLMKEGEFVLKLKTLDLLENEIKSIPEYIFMPTSELNIFYNLEGLQFEESFYELNELLEILDWEINLDDDTIEIWAENEQRDYILVFKNDNKLLSNLKKKLKLIEEKQDLMTEDDNEDYDTD